MRVDELQRRMGDAIDVQWKSFLLVPEPKIRSLEKFTRYTESWQRPADMEPTAKFTTPWASGATPPSSSFPAQMAWKASAHFGDEAQQRYHHALLDAYFVQNRDISNGQELAQIAHECDIDKDAFVELFTEQHDSLRDMVAADHNDATGRGVTAVPTVVLAGAFPVPGAQDVETYERFVSRVIERNL
ncbi:DsbA family protein [bacterium]|nr:DsbA family protein [bacterium]